jgi:plastocyanin
MLTPGSRFYFGLAAFAFVAAGVQGVASGGDVLGVISLGLAGAVGELFTYTVLVALAAAAFFLGLLVIAYRDADPEEGPSEAEALELARGPLASPSTWPIVGAFGAGTAMVGLVVGEALFILGVLILSIVVIEWMVQAWSDRATGDPAANRRLRDRVMLPVEIPAAAVLGTGVIVLALSRVLLALPKDGSVIFAIAVASLIMGIAILLSMRPSLRSGVVTVLLLIGGVAIISGGIVSAAVGERDVHPAEEEGAEPEPPGGDGPAGGGDVLTVVAENISFDTDALEVTAGQPFTLELDNRDAGVPHDIAIPELGERTDVTEGPDKQQLELKIDDEGPYDYVCDVHPETMRGTLTVG